MQDKSDLEKLCEEHGVVINSVEIPVRPDGESWHDGASHWHVTISKGDNSIHTFYSQGSAHRRKPLGGQKWGPALKPKTVDVLYSLIMDGYCGRQTFCEFCWDMGLDEDSRKAFKTWEACVDIHSNLNYLLGSLRETFETASQDY